MLKVQRQPETAGHLRNTTALTAKDGAINGALGELRDTVGSTGPLLRDSLQSVRADIDAVSRQTVASEAELQRLSDTRPVMLGTLATSAPPATAAGSCWIACYG